MPYPSSPGWKAQGTSEEAAHKIASRAKTVRDRVHFFLKDRYPSSFSADQIADCLGESILTIRPRVSELNRSGLIETVAKRRKNVSGMSAHCWRAKGGAQ